MSAHTTARHLLLAALASTAALQTFGAPAQAPLSLPDELAAGEDAGAWWKPVKPARSLRGRFLHVTDLHPDPYYVVGVSTKHACHRRDSKGKKHHRSAAYGTPLTGCDSPLQLVNETLAYIAREWADEIDFVVWTGDSARHDNDRKHPRTPREIYDLNRLVARQMQDAFTSKGIPVIPSLGVYVNPPAVVVFLISPCSFHRQQRHLACVSFPRSLHCCPDCPSQLM
jgi:endopolyphosphatase